MSSRRKYKGTQDLLSPTSVKVVRCDFLNIRRAGNINAPVLFTAKKGEEFTTSSLGNEWTEVYTKEGESGYCMTKYLEVIDEL